MKNRLKLIFMATAALITAAAVLSGCEDDNKRGGDASLAFGITDYASRVDTIYIRTEGSWRIQVDYIYPSTERGWVSPALLEGHGSASIPAGISENKLETERTAIVVVVFESGFKELDIKQSAYNGGIVGAGGTLEFSEGSTVPYDDTGQELRIEPDNQGSAWSLSLEYSDAEQWCETDRNSGNGEAVVRLSYGPNMEKESRSVRIEVRFDGGTAAATLTQEGRRDDPNPPSDYPGWLELPQVQTASDRVFVTHYASGERNYSILYDRTTYAGVWVAYPLQESYLGKGRSGSWRYDPDIERSWQTDLSSSYGVSLPNNDLYARGHQIPNADRNGKSQMQSQTFYYTNSTPQIQNRFNGSIWNTLENLVRDNVGRDTMYVVTGAVFRTVGGNEQIKEIVNHNDNKRIPVPNYYYKALLRPKGASYEAIGFWFEHKSYSNGKLTREYACSVRDIERKTGLNLYANLPQDVQDRVETQYNASDWGL